MQSPSVLTLFRFVILSPPFSLPFISIRPVMTKMREIIDQLLKQREGETRRGRGAGSSIFGVIICATSAALLV